MDTATRPPPQLDRTRDNASNIVMLEHVNLQIGDQQLATAFYVTGLLLTRDPYLMVGLENMWINAGRSQFHLPSAPSHVQKFRGVIGLVVADLDAIEQSLERAAPRMAQSRFAFRREGDVVEATCPWGNRFRCHAPDSARWGQTELGIAYLDLDAPVGSAAAIADFYTRILDAPTALEGNAQGLQTASVRVGADQRLNFVETRAAIPAYDGHHIQIYVADFGGPYQKMLARNHVSRDTDTHEWRFIDILDLESEKTVYQLEHEVRSMRHPLFGRSFVNRNPAQSNRDYRKGQDAFRGTF